MNNRRLPSEWRKGVFGEIAEIVMGQSPDGETYNETEQGVPLLNGPTEFTGHYPVPKQWTTKPTKLCQEDDILFCVRGSSTGRMNVADRIYCLGRGVAAIRAKRGRSTTHYVRQQLSFSLNNILKLTAGSTFPNIDRRSLESLVVLIPPLNQQEIIADILESSDRDIENIERFIAIKARIKRGLMRQLLTGRKRFEEFVIDDGTHLTQFGPAPNDWEYLHIGDIAKEVSSKNTNGKNLTVLSCTKHHGLVDSLKYFGKRVFSENTANYKIVKRGQFAYATNHIEEGSIGYQDLYDEALISPMYTVFETNERVDDSFFYKLLKTELYRHIFEINTSGSIDRRGGLRWNDFARIKVALPSLSEQRRIAAVLNTCDKEISLLKHQLDALKRQKRGLMQKLLTGQIRVKV